MHGAAGRRAWWMELLDPNKAQNMTVAVIDVAFNPLVLTPLDTLLINKYF